MYLIPDFVAFQNEFLIRTSSISKRLIPKIFQPSIIFHFTAKYDLSPSYKRNIGHKLAERYEVGRRSLTISFMCELLTVQTHPDQTMYK